MLVRDSIAGTEDGKFTAVKGVRVMEVHVAHKEADKDELATGRGVAESILHRLLIACAIKDQRR